MTSKAAVSRYGAMPNSFNLDAAGQLPERLRRLVERRRSLLGPGYRLFYQRPVEFVRASGVRLYDADGQAYLDAYNNVPVVGHCHPKVAAAVARQTAELNTNTRYLTEPLLDYAERLLASHHPALTNVMFACTGSEANDLALRIARHATGHVGVIVSSNAYHGVTTAVAEISPSLGDREPLGHYVRTVAPPAAEGEDPEHAGNAFARRVEDAIADLRRHGFGIAAVIVDPLFCSDGLIPEPAGFLAPVADAAHRAGALLLCDEVQAGFGRTGTHTWGYQRHEIEPDLVTMGKPMGNGIPISGVAAKGHLLDRFGEDVRYFNTFGANSVSIAAASAVLDVLEEEELLANARAVGAHLLTGLAELASVYPILRAARGVGLYAAADVVNPSTGEPDPVAASKIVNGMRERHVLISSANRDGTALKIRPPLPFAEADAGELLQALDDVLSALPE